MIKSEFVTESYHCIPRISFQGWAAAVAVAAALLLPPAFAPMGEASRIRCAAEKAVG